MLWSECLLMCHTSFCCSVVLFSNATLSPTMMFSFSKTGLGISYSIGVSSIEEKAFCSSGEEVAVGFACCLHLTTTHQVMILVTTAVPTADSTTLTTAAMATVCRENNETLIFITIMKVLNHSYRLLSFDQLIVTKK